MTGSLYGRAPEIGIITSALETVREGAGGTVHIVGEAGIGKTALLSLARQLSDENRFVSPPRRRTTATIGGRSPSSHSCYRKRSRRPPATTSVPRWP